MRAGIVVAIVLLPLAGQAAADPEVGALLVRGGVHVPAGARVAGSPTAALLADAGGLEGFSSRGAAAQATLFEVRTVVGPWGTLQSAPLSRESWRLAAHAIVVDDRPGAGFLGFYPRAVSLEVVSRAGTELEARARSVLATRDATAPDAPEADRYLREARGPHVALEAAGDVALAGDWSMKLLGPTVRLSSAGATRVVETGVSHPSPVETVVRWLHVDVTGGEARFSTGEAPLAALFPEADVAWDGVASMRVASGWLGAATVPPTEPATLEGALTANARPVEDGGQVLALLQVDGELRATSLFPAGAARAPAATVGAAIAWLVAGGLLVAAGGSATVLLRRPRRPAPPAPVDVPDGAAEGFQALSRAAVLAARWTDALAYVRLAQRYAPTSIELRLDEAFLLECLGRFEEAYAVAQETARMAETGDAHFQAALYATHCDVAPDEVAGWVVGALDRSPGLWQSVEQEPLFSAVVERPAVRRALARAKRQDAVGADA